MESQKKKCHCCQQNFPYSSFSKRKSSSDGLQLKCKTCFNKWHFANRDDRLAKKRAYNIITKNERKIKAHQYYLQNKEKINQYNKQWAIENKEKIKQQKQKYQTENRQKYTENMRRWRKENPERERQNRQKYAKFRRQNDPQYVLRVRLSGRLKSFLKNEKGGRTSESLIGYSMHKLKNHLEKAFIEGMSWEKFLAGKIDIHHIVPNAAFKYTTIEEKGFKLCWSLKNLCPEWREINRELNDYLPDGTRAMNLTNKITTQEEFDYWYSRCLAMRLVVRNNN